MLVTLHRFLDCCTKAPHYLGEVPVIVQVNTRPRSRRLPKTLAP